METVSLTRKIIVAIGFGLIVASLRLETVHAINPATGGAASYWDDLTLAVLVVLLAAVGVLFLATSVLLEDDRFLGVVSGIGAVLLGLMAFIPLGYALYHLSEVRLGGWLGLAGGASVALGAARLKLLVSREKSKRYARPVYLTWLLAVIGVGLVGAAVPMPFTSLKDVSDKFGHLEYRSLWNSAGLYYGHHALGIAVIVVAAIAALSIAGAVLTRRRLFEAWGVTASLVLLGVVLYEPCILAFSRLGIMKSGSGLALEGALLAVGASLAAVLTHRGVIKLGRSSLRHLIAIAGVGLALAAAWTNVSSSVAGSIWSSRPLGAALLILLAVCTVLVVLSLALGQKRFLLGASMIGWVVAGYCANTIALVLPKTGSLGPAYWVGLAGGVVIGLSTVSLQPLLAYRTRVPEMTRRRLYASLAIGAGLAVTVASLWLAVFPAESIPGEFKSVSPSYWSFNGDHSLGIVMLIIAGSALVAAAGTMLTRLPVVVSWTLAASLALLGISAFEPVDSIFHLGTLRAGAWLALAGSLVAAGGAVFLALLEAPEEAGEPEVEASRPAGPRTQSRKSAKGRVPGTRAKK